MSYQDDAARHMEREHANENQARVDTLAHFGIQDEYFEDTKPTNKKETIMNQLTLIQNLSPAEIFAGDKVDAILKKIEDETKSVHHDVSTPKGRAEIASLAYKIAQSKTFMDDCGKKLGEDAKKTLDTINAERKKIRDKLDTLKEEIRKPLTEWELQEEQRKTTVKNTLINIEKRGQDVSRDWQSLSFDELNVNLQKVTDAKDFAWQEFAEDARTIVSVATERISKAIEMKTQHEQQQEELRVLRAEKEARERLEAERLEKQREEDRIKAEAETKARLEAQAKKDEQEREAKRLAREKELAAEKEAAIQLEKDESARKLKEAEVRAQHEKEQAVERERQRIEREKLAADEAEKKRQTNLKHRAKINNDVLKALAAQGIGEDIGKKIITAIVSGQVPHTKISY